VSKIPIVFATGSRYKREEVETICGGARFATPDGKSCLVGDLFSFSFQAVRMSEVLERDLAEMVRHKARSAYERLLVPCLVEHGGLIFEEHRKANYPGGLTQPMWDALGALAFLKETGGSQRRVIARAVFGYCDGSSVAVFEGDTYGSLAVAPKGSREYYWDTVFQPDNPDASQSFAPQTYAEIADSGNGLAKKVGLSQSTKALLAFLRHRFSVGDAPLFRGA
jgi:XTP/dITP diphosphohydrolase